MNEEIKVSFFLVANLTGYFESKGEWKVLILFYFLLFFPFSEGKNSIETVQQGERRRIGTLDSWWGNGKGGVCLVRRDWDFGGSAEGEIWDDWILRVLFGVSSLSPTALERCEECDRGIVLWRELLEGKRVQEALAERGWEKGAQL